LDAIEPKPLQKRVNLPQRQASPTVEYLNLFAEQETKLNINTMKTLLAVAIAALVASSTYGQSASAGGQPLGPKTTGPGAYSPPNSPYKKWTTAQLQQRRLDLYRQIPQTQTNLPGHRGEPVFIHHGGEAFSDQQREIYAIEGELNYRYQHGDKDAELKRAMPGQPHM
jgi:hypothetical protein